jgi:transcriptional antiterminator RfaH
LSRDQTWFPESDAGENNWRIMRKPTPALSKKVFMNNQSTWNELCWYLVQTLPKQEGRAESNLKSHGIETLLPRFQERRRNYYTGVVTQHPMPLFPSYIFARFKANDLYYKVRYTRGIRKLVSFGDHPTVIDEGVIAMIQSRIREDNFARIEEDLKPGDRVVIKEGPLKTFAGVFEREMKGADRVRILIETVSYQAHVEIERDMIKKISQAGLCA